MARDKMSEKDFCQMDWEAGRAYEISLFYRPKERGND
jgi:hypothetical protein